MQIQRIQTLYLLLAIVAIVLFIVIPFGFLGEMSLSGSRPSLLIPSCGAIVVIVAAIFTYKKFSLQRTLVVLSLFATAALVVAVVYVMTIEYSNIIDVNSAPEPVWSFGGAMLVIAFVALAMALKHIKADHKLLRSYDRLR